MKNEKRELDILFDILSYRRAYGSWEEEMIIEKYLDVIPNMKKDDLGNRYVMVGKHPTVMFSCHTDTVHHKTGTQKVWIDETRQEVFSGSGDCLGADDAAGMWLMIQLIKAGKRGLYVFHRGEECGGIGSDYIHDHTPELLEGIKYCIAFDRKGYEDVITHQASGRCCSDEFAKAFAGALGYGYKPSDRGLFTDSANYIDIIPECTNISVGYFDEHTAGEMQDYGFLVMLAKKLKSINFETLPVVREAHDPYEMDICRDYATYTRRPKAVRHTNLTATNSDTPPWNETHGAYLMHGYLSPDEAELYEMWDEQAWAWEEIFQWVKKHPAEAADILMDNHYSIDVLKSSYAV